MTPALGLDIGGTTARAAVVAADGRLLDVAKAALEDRSPEGVLSTVERLMGQLAAGRALEAVPLGVGFAGMLRGPLVVNAPNFGWRDVDFGGALSARLGRPVRLVNDLSAAAWGERSCGAARGADDVFTVFVGTGVGSAIIANGALVGGATQVAGEFGHVKVLAEGGRACGCGERGCLEAYLGGAKLMEWMTESGLSGTPVDLERLALEGEAVAKGLYDFAVGHFALAVANQVSVLNPAVLVLGGGVLLRCPGIVRRTTDVVMTRATRAARQGLEVRLAQLGDDSGLVGAALLAIR